MFKVFFVYSDWSNMNHVLNEVKNPIRTLKISAPLGLSICAIFYILANMAFFAYVPVVVPHLLGMMNIHHTFSTERHRKNISSVYRLTQLCESIKVFAFCYPL
jgi:amino acid transporter